MIGGPPKETKKIASQCRPVAMPSTYGPEGQSGVRVQQFRPGAPHGATSWTTTLNAGCSWCNRGVPHVKTY